MASLRRDGAALRERRGARGARALPPLPRTARRLRDGERRAARPGPNPAGFRALVCGRRHQPRLVLRLRVRTRPGLRRRHPGQPRLGARRGAGHARGPRARSTWPRAGAAGPSARADRHAARDRRRAGVPVARRVVLLLRRGGGPRRRVRLGLRLGLPDRGAPALLLPDSGDRARHGSGRAGQPGGGGGPVPQSTRSAEPGRRRRRPRLRRPHGDPVRRPRADRRRHRRRCGFA